MMTDNIIWLDWTSIYFPDKEIVFAIAKDVTERKQAEGEIEEAYQKLVEVADFLSRIEPHSPTPYLIRRAINWGSMSLIDLMQEIVHDQNDYKQILQLLGAQNKSAQ